MPPSLELYDLTAADPLYKREDRRFVVYTANQKIELGEPVYAASLRVRQVNPDGSTTLLTKPDRYTWSAPLDGDQTATAKGKARLDIAISNTWPPEGDIIIKSFSMLDVAVAAEYQISVEYQALYTDPAAIDEYSMIGPDYSPGLMRSVLIKIDHLLTIKNPTTLVTSESVEGIRSLEEDRTGYSVANHVLEEQHNINVPNNKFIVRPVNGSFYKHDLVILDPSGVALVEDVDYMVVGVNHGKTKISTPSSGVYEYIVVIKPITGNIRVSYHAFGGVVSQRDINALRDVILSLVTSIQSSGLLTADSLRTNDLVVGILDRLDYIDETIRHYQMQSFPYALSANGSNDWVNVAVIERNPWSIAADIESSGNGAFQLSIENGNYYCDVNVSYNTTIAKALQMNVTTSHAPTFTTDGADYFDLRAVPVFRLLWNGSPAAGGVNYINDGLILQMKMIGVGPRTLVVKIKDKSGANSPWTLTDSLGLVRPALNDNIPYPGTTLRTWVAATSTNKSSNTCALFKEGYTIFAGAISIAAIEEASYSADNTEPYALPVALPGLALPVVIDSVIDLEHIKQVRVSVYDRLTGNVLSEFSTEFAASSENEVTASLMYYIPDLCGLNITLKKDTDYTLLVRSTTGTNSLLNDRFELLMVDIVS